MLTVCTWHWGDKYGPEYVERLRKGVARHLRQPYRFVCFTPEPGDPTQGCLCRVRMFDTEWQKRNGIDDRLVNIDLDTIITGPLDELFDRPEPFVVLQQIHTTNPCPFSCGVTMLRAGAYPQVWDHFSLDKAKSVSKWEPDDQWWIWSKLRKAAAFTPKDGVYGFQKPGWKTGDGLPSDARIVTFVGPKDPKQYVHLDWVKEHWL